MRRDVSPAALWQSHALDGLLSSSLEFLTPILKEKVTPESAFLSSPIKEFILSFNPWLESVSHLGFDERAKYFFFLPTSFVEIKHAIL